ncbi:glycolate oxidase subunit GlcE [Janthinobacterium sp. HH01]|uniref:glycolate oxidase subunit GlcE n=1 Tax=Janthinobacterium sp. HH01 TaxID=1198452 RepID=UPI0002AEBB83|nr:glycolate oxidase subunit GlcE [Janthinobacterium sp. HH01]
MTMDAIANRFRQRIVAAGTARTPLRVRGGGSKDWYGQAPQGEVLETSDYRGIVAYEPTELVVTARCGTPLRELEEELARQGQMLAFEPPHFGPGATVGGMLAAGLSGPRRQTAGAVRDFVLGAVLMDGRGDTLRFGGQVMKNVAGYDVSRLLAGSLGMLGLVLEVSLKVLPRPTAEATLRLELAQEEALLRLNQWAGQPLPLSASAWCDGVLTLRLSGAQAAVAAAVRWIGGETLAPHVAGQWWSDVREHRHACFDAAGDAPLWRLSLPSTAPALPAPEGGMQLIEWGGSQRWLRGAVDPLALRAQAAELGGHATLFRGGDKRHGVFQPLAPAVQAIHRNLKQYFDPAGVFNPGRMYREL